jgi:hypothetical protein
MDRFVHPPATATNGANTAADHLDVLTDAVAQIPATHRKHLLICGDSDAATHAVLDWLTGLNSPRRRVEYSIGWSISEPERAAITTLPATAWSAALDADGGVREGAQVAELTGLLALGRWPAGMRVIVRRERPHPGAHLTLFEERDGWRYTAFVTNTSAGAMQWLEARHRGRDRRRPDRLATDSRPRRRPRPRRTETTALPDPAHQRPADPRATPPPATPARHLALGHPDHRRLHPDRGHPRPRLTPLSPIGPTRGPRRPRPPPR